MATEEDYKSALIKAHEAGDTDAAELFASKIKDLRSAGIQPVSQIPPAPEAPAAPVDEGRSSVSREEFQSLPFLDRMTFNFSSPEEHNFLKGLTDEFVEPPEPIESSALPLSERILFEGTRLTSGIDSANVERRKADKPAIREGKSLTDSLEEEIQFRKSGRKGEHADVSDAELQQYESDRLLPEIGGQSFSGTKGLKLGAAMTFTTDPAEQAKVAEHMVDGSKARQSLDGSWVLEFEKDGEQKEVVLNRIGGSPADAREFLGGILKSVGPTKIAAAGRTLLARVGLGAIGGAVTEAGIETAQSKVGGEFNLTPIAMETLFGAGGEIAIPAIKGLWNKVSAKGRQLVKDQKSLRSLIGEGLDREELKTLQRHLKEAEKRSTELGTKAPLGAQVAAGEGSVGAKLPLARLESSTRDNIKMARDVEQRVEQQALSNRAALETTFEKGTTDPLDVLLKSQETAEEVLKNGHLERAAFANKAYADAFDGVESIDVTKISAELDAMIQSSPNSLPMKSSLEKIKKALNTKAIAPDFDQGINAVTGTLNPPKLQPTELSPRMLQQINWYLRDLKASPSDASTAGGVRFNAGALEKKVSALLHDATGGKYTAADSKFKDLSKKLMLLEKSKIGDAAKRSEADLSQILSSVFQPAPEQIALSKRFFKQLRDVDPKAADDLYNSYFNARLDHLPDNAKPSKILQSIFGNDEASRNISMELAPSPDVRRRLNMVRINLQDAAKLENVSADKTAKLVADAEKHSGFLAKKARWITAFFTAKQVAKEISSKHMAKAFFESGTNPKWAKEFDRISNLDPLLEETASSAESFMKRIMEDMDRRTFTEATARSVAEETLKIPTNE